MKFFFLTVFSLFISIKMYASDSTKLKNIYHFNKNAHFSKPRNLLSRTIEVLDTLRWEARFDKSCCYFINDKNGKMDVDQWDYNKLTGIAFNSLNPMANTAMVGWRHNPQTHLIELIPYWHVQKKRFFNDKAFLTVAPDERFMVEIITNRDKNEVEIKIKTKRNTLKDSKIFETIPLNATLIHPYFGGTSRAPCDMHLFLRKLK
jgi:hypothetical protein